MELVSKSVPTPVQVMEFTFRDMDKPDDCHWVLFNHGTFYTFPKRDCKKGKDFSGDELVAKALEMSSKAILCDYKDWDCCGYYPIRELGHPSYIISSGLGTRLGWVIVGKTEKWPETEQQEAGVCYAARALYELDCQENHVVACSFPWSAEDAKK